ncbi:MAG: GNAT family N-acetyltransferase, partial [Gemmatimonadetes bacterium]|nr:GNAT family N-acetyltransferase [Gemmatimonadota bacterium]
AERLTVPPCEVRSALQSPARWVGAPEVLRVGALDSSRAPGRDRASRRQPWAPTSEPYPDGAFCGAVGLRWQPGTADLPPTCLGHAGFSVVPWKRGRGYAKKALGLLLPIARAEGLPHVELTTDPDNLASRRVIETNGGTLVEQFTKPAALGGGEALRYRILLAVALLCTLPAVAPAQAEWLGRAPTAADAMPATTAEAEVEGARHPRATPNNVMESAPGVTIAGTTERRCVPADRDVVRSGDFVAGPFAWYNEVWHQGYGKMWWQPSEMPPVAPTLIVRATRLDAPAEGRVYETSEVAQPSGPRESAWTRIRFYPTGIRLPTVGRWLLVATAGNNWGCVVHEVR